MIAAVDAAPKGSRVGDVRVHRLDIPYYRCAAGWISICQATMVLEMKNNRC